MMKKWHCFILLFIMTSCEASKLNITRKNIEVKNALSLFNKTPVKSIKSPDDDIIDCVNIYRQPAFDHPLLKNHTILKRPSYHPVENLSVRSKISSFTIRDREDTKAITQLWQLNGRCPKGTIPILRTLKEDFSRASTIKRYGKEHKSIPRPSSKVVNQDENHEHVVALAGPSKYYGGKATINVWQPHVQGDDEYSLAQILIYGSAAPNTQTAIEAGWMVSPGLFKDRNTRPFIYWTNDLFHRTGCYNLFCPGFVQTNKKIPLGAILRPVSAYHGSQTEISLYIWMERQQNVWWLKFQNEDVGYWPATLFDHLDESASVIEWGGEVVNNQAGGQHTTTEMGSGHFPKETYGGASYIRSLQVVDESGQLTSAGKLRTVTEKPKCYNIKLGNSGAWGDFFYFGRPGRNDKCK